MRRTIGYMGAHDDERRSLLILLRLHDSLCQRFQIIRLFANILYLPMVALKTLGHVIRVGQLRIAFDADVIVIVNANKLAKTQMSGQRSRFMGCALHQVTITANDIGMMVDDFMPFSIVGRRQMGFCDGHSDCRHHTLTKRAGGRFHTWRNSILRMAGSFASPLAKILEVLEGNIITGQMEHSIL